jgi:hypothetical protein
VAKVVDSSQVQIALFKKKLSPFFELTFVLLRFDHVAGGIRMRDHAALRAERSGVKSKHFILRSRAETAHYKPLSGILRVEVRLVWVLAAITTHDVPAIDDTVYSNGFKFTKHGRHQF